MTTTGNNVPDHISEIILRVLEGAPRNEDIKTLSDWLKEDKKNREYFDEVNTTFQASVTLSRLTPQKTDEAWGDLLKEITSDNERALYPSKPLKFRLAFKIAASLLLVAVSAFVAIKMFPQDTLQQTNIVKNAPSNNTRILLPDSSIVWLNTNSTLEYPPTFGSLSRNVTLKGEAFFDVKKGSKPFIVSTENIHIHVKGTKFNVRAYKDDQTIKTTLEEGKVELQVTGEKNVYIMKPGDQLILNTHLKEVTVKKVNPANFSAWKEEKLIFDNTPLNEIILKLENRYNIDIALDTLVGQREHLTMTIENENLDEVMDLIQLSSRLKVKKEKNSIVLSE